ncbi:DUF3231 family protein [Metabacillus sp. SLBN-84]
MKVYETIKNMIKLSADGEPKTPLHVGEVMALWTLLTLMEEAVVFYGVFLNTTTDTELVKQIETGKNDTSEVITKLKEFFIAEGVPLPPTSEEKPSSEQGDVPFGVRFTDNEIANFLSVKTATYITFCGTALAQSVRNDVSVMFLSYLTAVIQYSVNLKTLMIQRSWLKVPPYFQPPGLPKNT